MGNKKPLYFTGIIFSLLLSFTIVFSGCGEKGTKSTPAKKAEKKMAVPVQKTLLVSDLILGRKIFEEKNCSQCHSVFGKEEKVGPTLQTTRVRGSFLDIFSRIWNHAPAMAVQMRKEGLPRPQFGTSELNQVVSFLYMLPYLGSPGDKAKGEQVLRDKTCLTCHSIGGEGKKEGIPLDILAHYESQIALAQRMWNHGPVMLSQMISQGTAIPKFSGNDMNDLFAALASKGAEKTERKISLGVGNAKEGEALFKKKRCLVCHSLFGKGGTEAPDLGKSISQTNVASLTALLWNHAGKMQKIFREKNIPWPYLTETEMGDLVVFLYSLTYTDKAGVPATGKMVFDKKTCVDCHFKTEDDRKKMVEKVSDLTPVQFASMLWNHIPTMESKMVSQAVPWPVLSGQQMRDILAYLQSL